MIKRKKMLIVGGTGFIGYHLAKKAIKKNWIVDSLSINKPKKKRKLKRVKYIQADISRKIDLKKKIKNNYSFVINLGGYVNHVNKKKNWDTKMIIIIIYHHDKRQRHTNNKTINV